LSYLSFLLPLVIAGSAIELTPVAEWPLFTAPDGSFSVRLPGAPEVSGTPDDRTFLVRIKDSTYYVKSTLLPPSLQLLPSETLLEALRDNSVEALGEFGGSTLVRSDGTDFKGHPSILYLAQATPRGFPRTLVLARLTVIGSRVLTITHSAPSEGFQESRAMQFLESFSVR
jgi:hypothetical protein